MKKLVLLLLSISTPFSSYPINIKDVLYSLIGKNEEPVEHVQPFVPQVAIITIDKTVETKEMAKKLIEAAVSKDVLGVILVIDSSGGTGSKYGTLHDYVKKLSLIKPTVALVIAAQSGGYLIASATNYIVVHSTSAIGSIGIAWSWQSDHHTANEFMGAGKYKELCHVPPSQLSKETKTYLQDCLKKDYQTFLKLVVANRSDRLSLDNQKEWAEAQVFVGQEAVKVGLVDEIGTFFEAEQKIKELIRKKHPEVVFEAVNYV